MANPNPPNIVRVGFLVLAVSLTFLQTVDYVWREARFWMGATCLGYSPVCHHMERL